MSYTQLLFHIVFRPKDSIPAIATEHEEMLYRYIWGFVKEKGGVLYRIGGMPDHIHLFVQLSSTLTIANFVRDLKVATNIFLREHKDEFPKFQGWGRAYCAITHSYQEKDMIINYIKNQKEHHKKVSLRDELINLLKEYGVGYDRNYLLKD